jgi:hypothetical protein
VEHCLHFAHRLAGRVADLRERVPRTRRFRIEPGLRRRGSGMDGEQLLLDGVVEIAGQAVPLFLHGGLPDAPLVLGSQAPGRGHGRLAEDRAHTAEPAVGALAELPGEGEQEGGGQAIVETAAATPMPGMATY